MAGVDCRLRVNYCLFRWAVVPRCGVHSCWLGPIHDRIGPHESDLRHSGWWARLRALIRIRHVQTQLVKITN